MDRIRILGVALMVVVFCFVSTGAFADGEWETSGDNIYSTNSGNVGIGTETPQSKLHVSGGIKADGPIKANKHTTHMPWYNLGKAPQGSNVPGYMKLITPINQYEGNMFSIKIIGYRYGVAGTPVEIRCGGYAHVTKGLKNTDCHTEGTDDPVGIGVENDFVIITIGSGGSKWYYDHFTAEYIGWKEKDAEEFIWEFIYNTPPTTVNTNNVYVDDSAGTITTTGNVGIGTSDPQYNLHIHGTGETWTQITNAATGSGISDGFIIGLSPNNIATIWNQEADGCLRFGANNTEVIRIDSLSNVGIGTTSPQSKLAVNGTITATEVKVSTSGWSDFVFEDSYKLLSLDHVENYIKENKHLPDVPSAEQIAQDGLSMSEMMAKQMQKIEELTLYVIELKKQNEKLAEESTQLKARISSLEEGN